MTPRKLLWIGDAAVATGFARCTHETLKGFLAAGWEPHVLGLNYLGDPHDFPYPIYPCWPGRDMFGLGRTAELVSKIKPDLVVVQNDPWNVPEYVKRIGNVPVMASIPVDGKNCRGAQLNGLAHAVFWTDFGLKEARKGGYAGEASVIPLGVDLEVFKPMPKQEARRLCGLPVRLKDAFIVGNVNRNQPRKRLDLTIEYFAQWVHQHKITDAYLFLHVAPTGEQGYDVSQLMQYYGLANRLILAEPPIGTGASEHLVTATYCSFDVQVSTTQGEGWGLTTMEGMACGVPQIVPEWSALAEWATPSIAIPCTSRAVTPNMVNIVGGVPDRELFVQALHRLYTEHWTRQSMRDAGLVLVQRDEYRWMAIADRFVAAAETALGSTRV